MKQKTRSTTPRKGFVSVRPNFEEKRARRRLWLKRAGITIAVILVLTGLFLGWRFAVNTLKITEGGLFGLFKSSKLDGEDEGMVNILLAGNSADDNGHGGAQLTDSIMIASVNTRDKTATLWSVPRDLWVRIPGHGSAKINAAYVYGEQDEFNQSEYFEGGMGLLQKVVEDNFAIDIHYYALVNYAGLQSAVNAVGGIDVTINSSDPRGLYDPTFKRSEGGPLKLPNGTSHIDGHTALMLARARGNSWGAYGFGQSDFTRTENQRIILLALKDKVTSASTLANPLTLASLLDAVGDNVRTNFKTSELRRAYDISKEIGGSNIKSVSLRDQKNDVNLLKSYRSRDGQSALIPSAGLNDFSEIQAYVRTFATPPPETTTH